MAQQDTQTKCFFFDVFGTCVDWRKTVTSALINAAKEALASPASNLSDEVRKNASDMTAHDWGDLATEWRDTYLTFTRSIAKDPTLPYKTVDQHHHDALRDLLASRKLLQPNNTSNSLWDDAKVQELSLIWHYLDPWPDTVRGIQALNTKFSTCTLSNGNLDLLNDMVKHARMEFTHVYSAQMFNSYKPNPKVYLGAAEKMGLKPSECGMVAAHLGDLKAAKSHGFRTVYVARPREEGNPELKDEEGIVDVWVSESEEGFVTAAERLGC